MLDLHNNDVCHTQLAAVLDRTCAPTLILVGGWSYCAVLGFVYTDRWIVQRLTDIIWLKAFSPLRDSHKHRVARIFTALKEQIAALRKFYDSCKSLQPVVRGEPHPRFSPCWTSCTTSEGEVRFKYVEPLGYGPQCVTWKAVVVPDDSADTAGGADSTAGQQPKFLAVKFVDRYGHAAHDLLAAAGYAPKLHYIGSLDGKEDVRLVQTRSSFGDVSGGLYDGLLRMAVMDFVPGQIGRAHV